MSGFGDSFGFRFTILGGVCYALPGSSGVSYEGVEFLGLL